MLTFQAEPLARVKEEAPALAGPLGGSGSSHAQRAGLQAESACNTKALSNWACLCWSRPGKRRHGFAAMRRSRRCPAHTGQGVVLAALDGLYLTPEARHGLAALRLLRQAEKILAERGVGLVQYSSPESRPCDALYRRLGARRTETIWHKEVETAQY